MPHALYGQKTPDFQKDPSSNIQFSSPSSSPGDILWKNVVFVSKYMVQGLTTDCKVHTHQFLVPLDYSFCFNVLLSNQNEVVHSIKKCYKFAIFKRAYWGLFDNPHSTFFYLCTLPKKSFNWYGVSISNDIRQKTHIKLTLFFQLWAVPLPDYEKHGKLHGKHRKPGEHGKPGKHRIPGKPGKHGILGFP